MLNFINSVTAFSDNPFVLSTVKEALGAIRVEAKGKSSVTFSYDLGTKEIPKITIIEGVNMDRYRTAHIAARRRDMGTMYFRAELDDVLVYVSVLASI